MQATHVLVDKKNIRDAKPSQAQAPSIGDGEILVAIEKFAVTANNVTYAATGDQLGYWKFFPSGADGKGIVPVWGFATVVESKCGKVPAGERLYGYFPMGTHLVMRPGRIRSDILIDVSEHRTELPPVYNGYFRLGSDASTDPDMDDRMSLLQPLFATSWLLADFLSDNEWFGAEQIIIGSASSKTGIGLVQFLAEMKPKAPAIVGLTSQGNRSFVEALGDCDSVVSYDQIGKEIAQVPSVYVDMAGNAEVRSALHNHLGDNMKHSAAVGTSHWDRFAPTGDLPGAKPRFFFAPAQIVKRRKEWGEGVVEKHIDEGWRRLAMKSRDWLTVEHHKGMDAAAAIYGRIADGGATPDEGHVVIL